MKRTAIWKRRNVPYKTVGVVLGILIIVILVHHLAPYFHSLDPDIALILASILLTVLLAAVGVEMANNPPASGKEKWAYRLSFIFVGILLVGITYLQSIRSINEQNKIKEAGKIQRQELQTKMDQMQGKLDNITNFVSHPPRNFSPADVTAAVRAMVGKQQTIQAPASYGNLPARCSELADAIIGRAQWRMQQRPDRQTDLENYKGWFELNDGIYFRADLYNPIKKMQKQLADFYFEDAQLDDLMEQSEMYFDSRQRNVDAAMKNPEGYHLPIEKIMEIGQRLKALCPK